MFVPDKLFLPSLANTLAYCKNSQITDVKSFITLGPGPPGLQKGKHDRVTNTVCSKNSLLKLFFQYTPTYAGTTTPGPIAGSAWPACLRKCIILPSSLPGTG